MQTFLSITIRDLSKNLLFNKNNLGNDKNRNIIFADGSSGGEQVLRRIRKTPIKELIKENIRSLLSDKEALARIEEKLEARLMK